MVTGNLISFNSITTLLVTGCSKLPLCCRWVTRVGAYVCLFVFVFVFVLFCFSFFVFVFEFVLSFVLVQNCSGMPRNPTLDFVFEKSTIICLFLDHVSPLQSQLSYHLGMQVHNMQYVQYVYRNHFKGNLISCFWVKKPQSQTCSFTPDLLFQLVCFLEVQPIPFL